MKKSTFFAAAALASMAAHAASEKIIDVYVGFVSIDDRSYQVVVLNKDSVGDPPSPTYCGAGFRYGFLKYQSKRPDGVVVDTPGCWIQQGQDRNSRLIFRYFSTSQSRPGVHEFSAPMGAFYPAKWEWKAGAITDIRFE